MKIADSSGGMLLYAIVVAVVISFTCSTLTLLVLNQYKSTDSECKRKESIQILRAGMEYAYDMLRNGSTVPPSLPGHPDVMISVTPDPDGISSRKIVVTTDY